MDARTGQIREVDQEEHAALVKKHVERLSAIQAGTVSAKKLLASDEQVLVPLTQDEADFLRTKGIAFRQLWGKRLLKGLKTDDRVRFDAMVKEFVNAR